MCRRRIVAPARRITSRDNPHRRHWSSAKVIQSALTIFLFV